MLSKCTRYSALTSDNGVSMPQNHALLLDGPPISVRAWSVSTHQNHLLLLRRAPNTSTCTGFSQHNKIPRCHIAVHTLWEKGIQLWHPDYDPDQAQKLAVRPCPDISRLATFHPNPCTRFLSNLAHRQTDKRTRACGQKHIPRPLSEVMVNNIH